MAFKQQKQQQSNGSLLHAAVRKGYWSVVDELIEAGCDVNLVDQHKRTPLWYAVRKENTPIDVLQKLVSPKNLYMKDSVFENVMSFGQIDYLHLLLQCEFNAYAHQCKYFVAAILDDRLSLDERKDLFSQYSYAIEDNKKAYIMKKAVKKRCWDIVSLLVRSGLNGRSAVLHATSDLLSPLHKFYFLTAPKYREWHNIFKYRNRKGRTLLHTAVMEARWDLVQLFAEMGENIINTTDRYGMTPLMYACYPTGISTDVALLLISHENINVKCTTGTALQISVRFKNWPITRLLVQHGAHRNIFIMPECFLITPLHALVREGIWDIVLSMIENGKNSRSICDVIMNYTVPKKGTADKNSGTHHMILHDFVYFTEMFQLGAMRSSLCSYYNICLK